MENEGSVSLGVEREGLSDKSGGGVCTASTAVQKTREENSVTTKIAKLTVDGPVTLEEIDVYPEMAERWNRDESSFIGCDLGKSLSIVKAEWMKELAN